MNMNFIFRFMREEDTVRARRCQERHLVSFGSFRLIVAVSWLHEKTATTEVLRRTCVLAPGPGAASLTETQGDPHGEGDGMPLALTSNEDEN